MVNVVTLSPPLSPQVKLWRALREAARALEAAANAVLGESGQSAAATVSVAADDFYSVVQTVNEFLLAHSTK